jgi:hypothetical protein
MTRSRLSFCSQLGALALFTALAISPSQSQAISLGPASHHQRLCQERARELSLGPPGTQHSTSNDSWHVPSSHPIPNFPFIPPMDQDQPHGDWPRGKWGLNGGLIWGPGWGPGRGPYKAHKVQPCAITPEPGSVLQIATGLILLSIFRSAFRRRSYRKRKAC